MQCIYNLEKQMFKVVRYHVAVLSGAELLHGYDVETAQLEGI